VARAARLGLRAIALTDHDTVAGVAEALAAGERLGVPVVAGCEFSVAAPWGEMHLLAYFLPVANPRLEAFLEGCRGGRARRADAIVAKLHAAGVPLDAAAVARAAAGGAIGRPHVARALVREGYAASVNEAFDRWLGVGRAAYVPKELPTLATVAALVHELGGIVSAAHLRDRATRPVLETFRDDGLDALEVRHPLHDPATRSRPAKLARQLGLAASGGSDWHGDGDTGHAHGALGSEAVPDEWLVALEARRPAGAGVS